MTAAFISTEDTRWTRALEFCDHDVYHLPEYVDVAGKQEGCQPTAFYAEDREGLILIPLLVRRLPDRLDAPNSWRDATSPYGYGGPIVSRGCPDSKVAQFLASFVALCQHEDIISAFIRTHPLIPFPSNSVGAYGKVENEGETVTVDIRLNESLIRAEMEHGHKQRIKKLERVGFSTRIDEWSLLTDFISLYRATM